MADQHPITPPPELVQQWTDEIYGGPGVVAASDDICLAKLAAQWGYDQRGEVNEAKLRKARDQELEACCELLDNLGGNGGMIRRYRRPKPPSLKEKALAVLEDANLDAVHYNIIRRALEDSDD